MGTLYIATSGANPTTAAQSPIALTAAVTTVLQIATPSNQRIKVVEYGISFDNTTANTPVKVELIQTDVSVSATGSTSRTPDPYFEDGAPASLCVGGTTATCFHSGAGNEGTITATKTYDVQFVPPTGQYVKQWPLGREPGMGVSKFLRIRCTPAASVNCYAYAIWDE